MEFALFDIAPSLVLALILLWRYADNCVTKSTSSVIVHNGICMLNHSLNEHSSNSHMQCLLAESRLRLSCQRLDCEPGLP